MQRKRGELVPISESFGDLDGPVKTIRDLKPVTKSRLADSRTRQASLFHNFLKYKGFSL